MARGLAFTERDGAVAFARKLTRTGHGVVVKADGLAAGKGVTVCDEIEEAVAAIDVLFAGAPGSAGTATTVVIEERLTGPEASLIALTDGRTVVALPAA